MRRVVFRPAAIRDFQRLDKIVQLRIDAGLTRYATTGHGDVKALKGRAGEFRLRIGKWRVFFILEPPDLVRVLGIDNRGEAY
ncbi:MAG: plasmid stabilization protein [Terriglobia bacterium]|nr:MAG: plasmid stabilization protein [Terriglobia bacterium]